MLQLWVVQVIPLRVIGIQCVVSPEKRANTTTLELLMDSIPGEGVSALDTSLYTDPDLYSSLSFASEESNMLCRYWASSGMLWVQQAGLIGQSSSMEQDLAGEGTGR